MATYAIGDIHGCFRTLQALLERINFDPARDRIWLVGDLVNRGRHSLEVLRWAYSLGERCTCVLGNHDLFLLAKARGIGKDRRNDTLGEILGAKDRFDLLDWLRSRPLLHMEGDYVLVHAGLHPCWTLAEAKLHAQEAEAALQGRSFVSLLATIRINNSIVWNEHISGRVRTKLIINVLTRMRLCSPSGQLFFKFYGAADDVPEGYLPWFRVPGCREQEKTILFGHWSALGFLQERNVICLDSGCVYGGGLTALRLEDREVFGQPSVEDG